MSESNEPDWLAELAKGGEALQREAMRIVKAAEEFAASGQARPFTQRVVRAVGAGIRELAASEPVAHELTLATTVTGTASATGVSMITKNRCRSEGFFKSQECDSSDAASAQDELPLRNSSEVGP
jgi:hypothetical protein